MSTLSIKVVTARALRSSFCTAQRDLLTESFLTDEMVLSMVREMQEQHKIFIKLTKEIKEEDRSVYEDKILGI